MTATVQRKGREKKFDFSVIPGDSHVTSVTAPVLTLITRHPAPGILLFLVGLASLGSRALVHLITLPVELDASFGKALPILKEGRYVDPADEAAVRRLLRAAAFTYVAASLAGLLNVWRWLRLLRR